MKFQQKVRKFFTGEAVEGIYRWRHPIKDEDVLKEVDPAKLEEIRQKYSQPYDRVQWPKYADPNRWLKFNIRRAQDLQLVTRPKPLRILDLGSGAGYFLLVAKHLGHSGLGVDVDEVPMYGEMFDVFGLKRVILRIEPYVPLPDFSEKFDLVTAFSLCFNGHKTDHVWGPKEWSFFLRDVRENVLNPGGEIYFGMNPEPDGTFLSPEVARYFEKEGAIIREHKVWFRDRKK
jgi:SAM-dependent methyltransferase